jgi:hypothetical protein
MRIVLTLTPFLLENTMDKDKSVNNGILKQMGNERGDWMQLVQVRVQGQIFLKW